MYDWHSVHIQDSTRQTMATPDSNRGYQNPTQKPKAKIQDRLPYQDNNTVASLTTILITWRSSTSWLSNIALFLPIQIPAIISAYVKRHFFSLQELIHNRETGIGPWIFNSLQAPSQISQAILQEKIIWSIDSSSTVHIAHREAKLIPLCWSRSSVSSPLLRHFQIKTLILLGMYPFQIHDAQTWWTPCILTLSQACFSLATPLPSKRTWSSPPVGAGREANRYNFFILLDSKEMRCLHCALIYKLAWQLIGQQLSMGMHTHVQIYRRWIFLEHTLI